MSYGTAKIICTLTPLYFFLIELLDPKSNLKSQLKQGWSESNQSRRGILNSRLS